MSATSAVKAVLACGAAAAMVVAAVAPASAQGDAVPAPPAPAAQVIATNALLRPVDLVAPLTAGTAIRTYETGFRTPPGGQDPYPVCVTGPQYTTVQVPAQGAIGWTASAGYVVEGAYEYASAAAAARAWSELSADIASRCKGIWHQGTQSGSVSTTRLPAVGTGQQGWGVRTAGSQQLYSALHLIDDAIVMLSFAPNTAMMLPSSTKAPAITSSVAAATDALAAALTQRWGQRASLPLTQDRVITRGQAAMMRLSDLPPSLPVTTPQQGGWNDVTADLPGSGPMTCSYRAKLPAGTAIFTASYGGDGGALMGRPGVAVQFVETYASPAAALAAWTKVRAAVLACDDPKPMTSASMQSLNRQSSGVSALAFDGVQGAWSRSLTIDTGSKITDKEYTIHLLVGSAIQTVTYVTGRQGKGSVRLDQVAVNALAQQLATRWVVTQSAP